MGNARVPSLFMQGMSPQRPNHRYQEEGNGKYHGEPDASKKAYNVKSVAVAKVCTRVVNYNAAGMFTPVLQSACLATSGRSV